MSEGRAFDWDETIHEPNEGGGGNFVLLEPGEYSFRVTKFERGQFRGSEKTPACKKAIITLEVDGGAQGTATMTDDLMLHSNFEWKLCQFFKGIGDRKSGESLTMNWRAVTGKTGRCKIKHRTGTGQYKDKKYNEIDKYLDPSDVPEQAAPSFNPDEFAGTAPSPAPDDDDGWG